MALQDKYSVLIDWDGDGFFNEGVPLGTPPNLIPTPAFVYPSNILGTTITGHEDPINEPTIIKDITDVSAQYASIPCGGSNSLRVFMGMRRKYNAQPLPGDITSTFGGSIGKFSYRNVYKQYSNETEPTLYGDVNMIIGEGNSIVGGDASFVGETYVASPYSNPGLVPTFPVVAGNSYRISFWYKCKEVAGYSTGWSIGIQASIYNSSSVFISTPIVTSVGGTGAGGWLQYTGTFTAPANAYNMVLQLTSPNTGAGVQYTRLKLAVTGFGLYSSGQNPNYVADPAVVYEASQFPVQLEANTAYNYSFYARSSQFTKVGVIADTVDIGTVTWTTRQTEQQTNISSAWTRINISFTTGSNPSGALLKIIPYVGSNPAAAGVTGTLDVRQCQLTKGANLAPFNSGVTAAYDNMRSYVTSVNWKLGKRSISEVMPYEGTCELNINNDSQIFSPANSASPLYGYFKQNRKIAIRVKSAGVWVNMWVGWLNTFAVTTGRNSQRDATITGRQGIYRFRDGEFSVAVTQNSTFKSIIKNVIENGSWKSAANAYEGVMDYNMRLNINAYTMDTDAAFARLDDGLNTYSVQGLDWGRNTTTENALQDVLNAENAGLWIDREGKINVVNRHFFIDRIQDYDVTVVADTTVNSAEYSYGENVTNKADVQFQPPKFNTNVNVWTTKNPPVVPSLGTRTLQVVFDFPEGRIKTVKNIQSAVTKAVYLIDPTANPSATAESLQTTLDNVVITPYVNGANKYSIKIDNNNAFAVYVSVTLNGDFVDTGSQVVGTYSDLASINSTLAVFKQNLNSPLISNVDQAVAMAQFVVSRNAFPIGAFNKITLTDDDTTATLALMLSLKQGAVIKIDEKQTVEKNRLAMVVEESGSISGGVLKYNVTLDKLDPQVYYRLDVGTLESSNAAVSAFPTGVRGTKVDNTTVDNVAVKEISSGTFDGATYFIDDPLSVRQLFFTNDLITPIGLDYSGYKNFYTRGYDAIPVTASGYEFQLLNFLPVEPSVNYTAQLLGWTTHYTDASETTLQRVILPFFPVSGGLTPEQLGYWNLNGSTQQVGYNPAGSKEGYIDRTWGVDRNFVSAYLSTPNVAGLTAPTNAVNFRMQMISGGVQPNFTNPAGEILARQSVVIGLSLLKMSNFKNTPLDSTKTYKYAVWAKTARFSPDVSWTLDLLDSNHAVITSAAFSPSKTGVTKVECSLSSGYSYVTARIRKTSGNTEKRDDKLWIYGWACTEDSLTNYTDIPAPNSLVYI